MVILEILYLFFIGIGVATLITFFILLLLINEELINRKKVLFSHPLLAAFLSKRNLTDKGIKIRKIALLILRNGLYISAAGFSIFLVASTIAKLIVSR